MNVRFIKTLGAEFCIRPVVTLKWHSFAERITLTAATKFTAVKREVLRDCSDLGQKQLHYRFRETPNLGRLRIHIYRGVACVEFEPGVRLNCGVDPYSSINPKKTTEPTDETLPVRQYEYVTYTVKYQHVFAFYVQNMCKING